MIIQGLYTDSQVILGEIRLSAAASPYFPGGMRLRNSSKKFKRKVT
jgi:hypothetical protein